MSGPESVFERLAALGFEVVPLEVRGHCVLGRGGFAALAEVTRAGSLGRVGAGGLITEHGLAPLVWQGEEAWFTTRKGARVAAPDEVAALRQFQTDLESAIRGSDGR